MTWDAVAKYMVESAGGQLFVILTPDIIAKASQKSPAGFDWTTLLQDLTAAAVSNCPMNT